MPIWLIAPLSAVLNPRPAPGGTFEVAHQVCSAHSDPVSGTWHLEVDGEIVLESRDLQPLPGAPFTVVTLTILPEGAVQVSEPIRAERPPDVPISLDY